MYQYSSTLALEVSHIIEPEVLPLPVTPVDTVLPVPVTGTVLIQNGCQETLTLKIRVSPTLHVITGLLPLTAPFLSAPVII